MGIIATLLLRAGFKKNKKQAFVFSLIFLRNFKHKTKSDFMS